MQKRTSCFRLANALLLGGLLMGIGVFPTLAQPSAEDLIRRLHPSAAAEFRVAWAWSHAGAARTESVVLVSLGADGRLYAKAHPSGNQHHRSIVSIHSGVGAIFHSHPNSCDPTPSLRDRRLADRLKIPIGTLTRRGLFVYDPATRRTTLLMRRLEWLDADRWSAVGMKTATKLTDAY